MTLPDIIRLRITPGDAREADAFSNFKHCLCATALKRQLKLSRVEAGYSQVKIRRRMFKMSLKDAERIKLCYRNWHYPPEWLHAKPTVRRAFVITLRKTNFLLPKGNGDREAHLRDRSPSRQEAAGGAGR